MISEEKDGVVSNFLLQDLKFSLLRRLGLFAQNYRALSILLFNKEVTGISDSLIPFFSAIHSTNKKVLEPPIIQKSP